MPNDLHDKVFDFLEQYRSSHPGFVYWLRVRDTGNRLSDGYWFQGNDDYAFVGLYNWSGGSNKTRSVGIYIWKDGNKIGSRFEVVFNEKDQRLLKFYDDIMQALGGFKRLSDTRFYKILSETNGLEATKEFFDNYKAALDKLVSESNLNQLFISPESFNERLQRILELKINNLHKIIPTDKVTEIKDSVNTTNTLQTNLALNTILYGPPGTGKTYNTVNKAIEIINPYFFDKKPTRAEIRAEYERLKNDGQIEFITFHQSMSYEDFIEGIKPKKPQEGDEYLQYVIEEGLFKRLAKRADYKPTAQAAVFSLNNEEFTKANFYKLSLGNTAIADDEQIYRYCIENSCIALGWGGANDFSSKTEHEIS